MSFAIIFDFFVAPGFDHLPVSQGEAIGGVFQVFFFDQDSLEGIRVKPESRAAFEAFFVGVHVDIFEILKRVVRGHVGSFGNRRINPSLCSSLYVDMLFGGYGVGADEIIR